jgi:hypothetical protein
MLEVVENKQHLAFAQFTNQLIEWTAPTAETDAGLTCQRADEILCGRSVFERHESAAVSVPKNQFLEGALCEARLANATWPDEAQQAALVLREQRADSAELN